ncbi:60S ribosomal protein L34, partial [Eschrichtius robustus]|nr:60S ribosomal protein L34 [Eschrichtius robustus]
AFRMVQRLTYRRRLSYNTASNKTRLSRTPGRFLQATSSLFPISRESREQVLFLQAKNLEAERVSEFCKI